MTSTPTAKQPTTIATNGNAYKVNEGKKTVKRVFNSMKELRLISNEIDKNMKASFEGFLHYLRTELPSEPMKIDKNTFTIKGYKFIFSNEGITCKDIMNFSSP